MPSNGAGADARPGARRRRAPGAGPVPRTEAQGERPIEVRNLGLVAYADALALQEELVRKRRAGEIPDQLLLLEHPHVITLGASARPDHVLVDEADRRLLGIELFHAGRGGDVTYHGPGQLVGYPILDLKPDRCDLHRYIRDLEEVLIRALGDYGVVAGRKEGLTGVWVGDEKIAAIGVRLSSGWITSHGFALNVDPNLDFFGSIIPCGIREYGVTSLARVISGPVSLEEVAARVAVRFAEVFGRKLLT